MIIAGLGKADKRRVAASGRLFPGHNCAARSRLTPARTFATLGYTSMVISYEEANKDRKHRQPLPNSWKQETSEHTVHWIKRFNLDSP
jgi:hypothetical protein